MSKIKTPTKLHQMKARIAIYMGEGHLHPQIYRTTLKFGQLFAATSEAQGWVSNDVLDALYQAAMVNARCSKKPYTKRFLKRALYILDKSGLVERGDGQARWCEDPNGAEAAMELAKKIIAKEKARYKAATAKAQAEESLGENEEA
jgi:hypothetical protein